MAGSVVRGGILFHPVRPAEPDAAAAARFADDFAGVAPLLGAWAACRVRGELRRRLEIEDLVQEIGLRAWLRIADFDPQRGTFRQWLFGFANRIWLETLREIGRDPLGGRLRRGGDSQLPAIADTVTTISRRVASDEQQRACRHHEQRAQQVAVVEGAGERRGVGGHQSFIRGRPSPRPSPRKRGEGGRSGKSA